MSVTIYHNPACGTSRTTLGLIREAGTEPVIVEYLKTPPSREALESLARETGLGPSGLLRRKEKLVAELGLDRPDATEADILDAIAAHPVLLNRPIVTTPKGARLCRPADEVREILPG